MAEQLHRRNQLPAVHREHHRAGALRRLDLGHRRLLPRGLQSAAVPIRGGELSDMFADFFLRFHPSSMPLAARMALLFLEEGHYHFHAHSVHQSKSREAQGGRAGPPYAGRVPAMVGRL